MPVTYRNIAKTDGKYGPTPSGKFYQPNPVHNQNAEPKKDKTRWCISEPHQYCVFEEGDNNNWQSSDGILGMDINDKKLNVLGEDGEKIAFFPTPKNVSDPWHGYPEKTKRLDDSFDFIFEKLLEEKLLSQSVVKRLLTKKI